jgi:hypothetical protein
VNSVEAHVSERNLRLPPENKILALVFPMRTSNLFQGLKFVFFVAMKNNKGQLANEPEAASIHGQIRKLVQAYEQIATSLAVRSCFRKAELSPSTQTRPFKLGYNEGALRQNDGLK